MHIKCKPSKHGESYTRLYAIWCNMKTRCLCPTSKVYPYYGGRGITVCFEWAERFAAFKEWAISNGYSENLELDRIDVNGNYEPSNCRWATRLQQMANTRKRCDGLTSKYKGVSWNPIGRNWKVQITVNGKNRYVGVFRNETEAARAYDAFALRIRGEYAHLNFTQEVCHLSALTEEERIDSDLRSCEPNSACCGVSC